MILPQIFDSNFLDFLQDFNNQNIRPAGGLLPSNYHNHGHIILVSIDNKNNYHYDECWFNCLEHKISNNGEIIFGWAFWQLNVDHFVAQHHAVWESPSGKILDVTPNRYSNSVVFMPDNQAPFDFLKLRCPFNFEKVSKNTSFWTVPGIHISKDFSIAVLNSSAVTIHRINSLKQLAIQKNISF